MLEGQRPLSLHGCEARPWGGGLPLFHLAMEYYNRKRGLFSLYGMDIDPIYQKQNKQTKNQNKTKQKQREEKKTSAMNNHCYDLH